MSIDCATDKWCSPSIEKGALIFRPILRYTQDA